jgi:alpha-glucuronidase
MRFVILFRKIFLVALAIVATNTVWADNGYKLWLGYHPITDAAKVKSYTSQLGKAFFQAKSEKQQVTFNELSSGLADMLNLKPIKVSNMSDAGLIIGTHEELRTISHVIAPDSLFERIGDEGYLIRNIAVAGRKRIIVTANTDIGLLYGVFGFLRLLETQKDIDKLNIVDYPRTTYRILDHWDNLNRTVERGYAGASIWNWHKLPGYIDQRYIDYARANASVGINGSVLNNVNANALILTPDYLIKVKALADAFRPYGIRVYLSVKFSSPIEIGKLKTADPLDPQVQQWWKDKANEIYRYIPDFGGFLVKANSEGQPGPQAYGRTHADGANMLADALAPHQGIVMWRAFVYDNNVPDDRSKQAYNEFKPFDGKFRPNVIVQVKNGPIDFQPREPFHPLFGAMPNTSLMVEFQLTQEYLGFSTHLVFEAPLFKECLDADTYAMGKGTSVASILEGKYNRKLITGMAGVANIGSDINWCGHPFAQANWFAFGRLAWNPGQSSGEIADEWLRMTFNNDPDFVKPMKRVMLQSRETAVNYMTPLGLHHIMGVNTHYGPGPWVDNAGRADWTAVYYHKADATGIGFDRTSNGSNAVGQYFMSVREKFENLNRCPEEYLLWFHHVKWTYPTKSGRNLWNELVYRYYTGADSVKSMQQLWNNMASRVDAERFIAVKQLMTIQYQEALRWRDACVLYFQTFSQLPIPSGYETPAHALSYYRDQKFLMAPGIGGNQ